MGKLKKVEDEMVPDKIYYKQLTENDSFIKKTQTIMLKIEHLPWKVKQPWDHINGHLELNMRQG